MLELCALNYFERIFFLIESSRGNFRPESSKYVLTRSNGQRRRVGLIFANTRRVRVTDTLFRLHSDFIFVKAGFELSRNPAPSMPSTGPCGLPREFGQE